MSSWEGEYTGVRELGGESEEHERASDGGVLGADQRSL